MKFYYSAIQVLLFLNHPNYYDMIIFLLSENNLFPLQHL